MGEIGERWPRGLPVCSLSLLSLPLSLSLPLPHPFLELSFVPSVRSAHFVSYSRSFLAFSWSVYAICSGLTVFSGGTLQMAALMGGFEAMGAPIPLHTVAG